MHDNKPNRSAQHPTMKPITLCARLIYNSSREGDTVYEPFGGSGTTIIAAEQLSRKCCAIELDAKYCDVIVKRFYQNFPGENIQLIRNSEEVENIVFKPLLTENNL